MTVWVDAKVLEVVDDVVADKVTEGCGQAIAGSCLTLSNEPKDGCRPVSRYAC